MKKILFLAAMLLGVVSCQRDQEGFDVAVGGEQEAVITLSLPEVTRSKSNTGFDFEDFANNTDYDLRFILEIAHNNGTETKVVRDVQTSNNGTSATFSVRLVAGREYTFTAWADLVDEGTNTDLYYNTANLANITLKKWTPMTEARDAYTCTVTEEFDPQTGVTMELKRPFAKVRVVSTDIQKVIDLGIEPTEAVVEYTSDLYTSYNAVAGTVAGTAAPKTHSFEYKDVDVYTDNTGEKTMFTDYILIPAGDSQTVIFSIDIQDATGSIKKTDFNSAIPVEVNKLTTLRGAVLTEGGKVSITVDGDLGVKETINVVGTASDLQQVINAIEDGEEGNIQLGGNVDLSDLFSVGTLSTRAGATLPIVIAEGKTLTLDLNGFNITAPFVEGSTTNHFYAFDNKGTFIIKDSKGNGKIIARGNYNYGTMTLESGSIVACDGNGGYAVKQCTGEFVMNGGQIVTNLEDDNQVDLGGYDATTLRVDNGAKATINGGTINNICDFTSAIDNNGELVINGGTITSIHTTIYNTASVIINNDAVVTCNGLAGVTTHTILTDSTGKVTINGGTFAHTAADQNATGASVINGNVEVNAGKFTGRIENYYGTPVLKGGNFNFNPTNFVAEGYGATEDNGTWSVTKAYEITDEVYTILTAPGMFWFANEVNSGANYFEGKTIKLGADIDLNNAEWTPIGSAYKDHGFMGNFDGNGYSIKNLKMTKIAADSDGYVYAGLFGVTEGVDKDNQNYIKNLTIENVNIDLNGHIVAAAIAYPYYTALENITVKGNVSIKGGNYTSGVLAYTRRCVDAKNISIEANAGSAVIEGNITVGGVISDIQMNGGLTANYSNFKAEGLTIKGTQSVGGISGIIGAQNLDGAIVKNVTMVSDDIRTGMISGSFDGHSVITNAVVENVTGADYYIGYLYKSTEGDRSSVTINGDKYTYNNGWLVNGCQIVADGLLKDGNTYIVKSANGLVALSGMTIKGGEIVTLGADINLEGVEFNGLNAFNPENNNTFDGQNYTVSNWTYEGGAGDMGFIRNWVGPVKDVKFENCHLKTAGRSAVVAAKIYGNMENVSVNNCSIVDSYWACGLVAGLYNSGSVSNVTVTNSSVKSNGGTAAIVGVFNESEGERGLKNCSVSNTTINNTGVYGEVYSGGALVGMFNSNATFIIEGCTVSNNTLEGGYVYEKYPANESVIEK